MLLLISLLGLSFASMFTVLVFGWAILTLVLLLAVAGKTLASCTSWGYHACASCYILILPLLFPLILPILTLSPRPGICPHLPLLLSLSSLISFPLTHLISSHVLPLNPLTLVALCDLGPTICIVSLSFVPTIQILTIGSSA